MAQILKGTPVAAAITEELRRRADALKEKNIYPALAILRVGENESDIAYERGALKRCEKVGITAVQTHLPATCTQEELMREIDKINSDESIHGCIMFRPLPKHLDEQMACDALKPSKDVDSMTAQSLITVFTGRGDGFAPCTAQSVIEMLDYYGYDPKGKNIVVIGRSLVIGKPVSMLLQKRNATVTMCHTKTHDMPAVCRGADILIAAAGKMRMISEEYTNPAQVVIDVGVNPAPDGGICGDVDFDSVSSKVSAISPVPSGVGSVTTAVLCKHVIEAAERMI